LAPV
ncbi:hypothetical protein CLOM_g24351, partial [Closterium sp. NIES-68]